MSNVTRKAIAHAHAHAHTLLLLFACALKCDSAYYSNKCPSRVTCGIIIRRTSGQKVSIVLHISFARVAVRPRITPFFVHLPWSLLIRGCTFLGYEPCSSSPRQHRSKVHFSELQARPNSRTETVSRSSSFDRHPFYLDFQQETRARGGSARPSPALSGKMHMYA